MARPKYTTGQRVRINEAAFYQGEYFVTVRLETGATVILRLPERCLDEVPGKFRL